jgi:hypothetical protein
VRTLLIEKLDTILRWDGYVPGDNEESGNHYHPGGIVAPESFLNFPNEAIIHYKQITAHFSSIANNFIAALAPVADFIDYKACASCGSECETKFCNNCSHHATRVSKKGGHRDAHRR